MIQIFCTGLGAVEPPIEDGQPSCAPDDVCLPDGSNLILRTTVMRPTVTISGLLVPDGNILLSGLAPQFAGLYQVNLIVPEGVPSGNAEVVISVAGQESAVVTGAVQ